MKPHEDYDPGATTSRLVLVQPLSCRSNMGARVVVVVVLLRSVVWYWLKLVFAFFYRPVFAVLETILVSVQTALQGVHLRLKAT